MKLIPMLIIIGLIVFYFAVSIMIRRDKIRNEERLEEKRHKIFDYIPDDK